MAGFGRPHRPVVTSMMAAPMRLGQFDDRRRRVALSWPLIGLAALLCGTIALPGCGGCNSGTTASAKKKGDQDESGIDLVLERLFRAGAEPLVNTSGRPVLAEPARCDVAELSQLLEGD